MNGFEVSLINDKIKYFKIYEIFPNLTFPDIFVIPQLPFT